MLPLPLSRIGVCSWSLRSAGPAELVQSLRECGVRRVQLHLDPIRTLEWRADETAGLLRGAGIQIVSGMMSTKGEDYSTLESIKVTGGVRPDSTWEENVRVAEGDAIAAARLGISLVTLHAGFLPHDPGDERTKLVERIAKVAEIFANRRIRVALETGQEDARTLNAVLAEVNSLLPHYAHVGVNFDPANMILYGMGDPVEALTLLAPHIMQVHIKDAKPSDSLGEWGAEMPYGQGSVHWDKFFAALQAVNYAGNFLIEREAGENRVADIKLAVQAVTGRG
jgi:L-ribulose-5-phosphate 3-epimerase